MVRGINIFRSKFANYSDSYVLIGGAACDILLEQVDVPFRATRDLDIVLCIEVLTSEFGRTFWEFIKDGDYQLQEKASGDKKFYRFSNPTNEIYPFMIELFSKSPDFFDIASNTELTPIPIDDEVSSLSAILLDSEYYKFIQLYKIKFEELSLLSVEALIVLKAKAFLDLTERKNSGLHVDSKDIKKHKNDVFRLLRATAESVNIYLPNSIASEMLQFINAMQDEQLDRNILGNKTTKDIAIGKLRKVFNL